MQKSTIKGSGLGFDPSETFWLKKMKTFASYNFPNNVVLCFERASGECSELLSFVLYVSFAGETPTLLLT